VPEVGSDPRTTFIDLTRPDRERRMLETVANQAVVGFFIACMAAIPLGFLVGWRMRAEAGIAAGCLLIGLAGCASAIWLGWHQWQWTRDSVAAEGVLLSRGDEPRTGRSTGAGGEGSANDSGVELPRPKVRFRADDGSVHELDALGGALRNHQPGDPVPVRYLRADPASAQVDDFQGLWGGVWAMTLFGVLPMLFGLFFVHVAWSEGRGGTAQPARPVRAGTRRGGTAKARALRLRQERGGLRLVRAALVVMVGSLVLGASWPDLDTLPSIGYAFIGVAAGLLLMMQGLRRIRPGNTQDTLILVILAVGFGLFGFGAVLLAG